MAEILQSVTRTLETLLLFGPERQTLGVTELARHLGCSTSTAQRTLHSLTQQRFLQFDERQRAYRLGPAVLHIARAWQQSGSLGAIALPAIEALAERTGLAATFAVPDHAHMRVVASVDGLEGPLRGYPMAGELFPMHAGAISKAYAATLPAAMRADLIRGRPLARYTDRTDTDPANLEAEFARVRERGYCVSTGEYDEHVTALAVPVRVAGQAFGAVAVSTTGALEVDEALVAQVRDAAGAIARLLRKR